MDTTEPLGISTDNRTYGAGGTRELPPEAGRYIEAIAAELARKGYTLSTGDARGADTHFIQGARAAGGATAIYSATPSKRHPGAIALSQQPQQLRERALALAAQFHPAWDRIVQKGDTYTMLLHARNGQEVLGERLDAPVRCFLCWAPGSAFKGGKLVNVGGGTGQAVRLAVAYSIPVYNLALAEHRARVERMLGVRIGYEQGQADLL